MTPCGRLLGLGVLSQDEKVCGGWIDTRDGYPWVMSLSAVF